MGIRITAFAIDCGGFRDWLLKPVGEVLFYIARHGRFEAPDFHVNDPQLRHRYHATANGDVLRLSIAPEPKSPRVRISPSDVAKIPILARQLGAYLREE